MSDTTPHALMELMELLIEFLGAILESFFG